MSVRDHLARVLNGEAVSWRTMGITGDELLAACDDHGVTALVYRGSHSVDWPDAVVRALADRARFLAVREEVCRRETASVLARLSAAGIRPVLLKGTPLAYTVYDAPSLRPRADTDVIVPRGQADDVRRVLQDLGYQGPPYCDGEYLFCQFELQRTDHLGLVHAFDVHWKISTQSMFADVLTCEEIAAESLAVPALGAHARTAGIQHALLVACVHPAMHHRNDDRLIWTLDVHLLAARLAAAELTAFAALAVSKRVAAVCARALGRAIATFGTPVPARVMDLLHARAQHEPSAAYLEPARRWRHDMVSNLRGLPGWRSRLALLREVLFPEPRYMQRAYGMRANWVGRASLPALYLHRGAYGAWKVLTHRK